MSRISSYGTLPVLARSYLLSTMSLSSTRCVLAVEADPLPLRHSWLIRRLTSHNAAETQHRGTYVLLQIKLLVVPNRHQRQPSTNSPPPHSCPIKHAPLKIALFLCPDLIEHMSAGPLMFVHSLPCNAGGFCWNDNNDHDLPKCSMLARATCR